MQGKCTSPFMFDIHAQIADDLIVTIIKVLNTIVCITQITQFP